MNHAWIAADNVKQAHGEGYAEGSDQRLAACLAAIDKYLRADVADSEKLHRIGQELGRWRCELAERGQR